VKENVEKSHPYLMTRKHLKLFYFNIFQT